MRADLNKDEILQKYQLNSKVFVKITILRTRAKSFLIPDEESAKQIKCQTMTNFKIYYVVKFQIRRINIVSAINNTNFLLY